tara:strand:+ start:88 stop:432 length:345 start_codon:yes stop_codon:yes gene_type:complete
MKITEEYQARFEKILDQMHQHVEMWIPEEEINVKDSFKTCIILYSFISSFLHKNTKDLLEELEKEYLDYQLEVEDFMKFKERKLAVEKSVSTKFLFLIKDLDRELKKLKVTETK